jgi:hypothetical protein
MIFRIAIVLVITGASALPQHTVTLNSGTRIEGRYDGGNADTLTFIDQHGDRHKFNIVEIQSLIFTQPPAPETSGYPERSCADTDLQPDAGWRRGAAIPAGTEIAVRTIDPIDVREPDPRRHFLATVENDVVGSNGAVVIPRGSEAHLTTHKVSGARLRLTFAPSTSTAFAISSTARTSPMCACVTDLARISEQAHFLRVALYSAPFRAAVAGGGKGAAIGALAGGAAGLGTQVLTRGSALHIPSETIVRFRLDHPVYLFQ